MIYGRIKLYFNNLSIDLFEHVKSLGYTKLSYGYTINFTCIQTLCVMFVRLRMYNHNCHGIKGNTQYNNPMGGGGGGGSGVARGGPSRARPNQLCCSKTLYTVEHL